MYRWIVGDLRTGKITRTVDLTGATWSTVIDDAGSLEGSFPLRATVPQGIPIDGWGEGPWGLTPWGGTLVAPRRRQWPDAYSDSAPAKQFMAVAWVNARGDEQWIEGGPIWTRSHDDDTGILRIGGAGLESYYDHRRVVPVLTGTQKVETSSVTYNAAQLSLIAKRLVELAHSHVGGDLAVVLPDDETLGGPGIAHTRTYPGYELGKIGERLRQLSEVIGGPEYQFVPRRRVDDPRYIEWAMRIGTPDTGMLLYQPGAPWIFDRTVPGSPITKVSLSEDGSVLGTRAYAAGQGQGEGRPVAVAESTKLTDLGYPVLEVEAQSTDSVSELTTLQGHAEGALARAGRPTTAITITLEAQTFWRRFPSARAGDWATLRLKGHDMLPDGDHDLRILAMSGGGPTVDLSCVPKVDAT